MSTVQKSMLYEYAVIYNPTKDEVKDGKKSILVINPTTVLATSEEKAKFQALRAIPEEYTDRFDQLDIAVRPF